MLRLLCLVGLAVAADPEPRAKRQSQFFPQIPQNGNNGVGFRGFPPQQGLQPQQGFPQQQGFPPQQGGRDLQLVPLVPVADPNRSKLDNIENLRGQWLSQYEPPPPQPPPDLEQLKKDAEKFQAQFRVTLRDMCTIKSGEFCTVPNEQIATRRERRQKLFDFYADALGRDETRQYFKVFDEANKNFWDWVGPKTKLKTVSDGVMWGDLSFTSGQLEHYRDFYKKAMQGRKKRALYGTTQQAFTALWPKQGEFANIDFEITDDLRSRPWWSSNKEALIKASLQKISEATCIRFHEVDSKSAPSTSVIKFQGGFGRGVCWGTLGYNGFTANRIWLDEQCFQMSKIVHEVMHNLGSNHEHQRPDRDEHIDIFYNNVANGMQQYIEAMPYFMTKTFDTEYDIKSVMHYPSTAFARPGKKVMKAKWNPEAQIGPGLGEDLTVIDVKGLNRAYQCGNRSSCVYGPWSEWSGCNKYCGSGQKARIRWVLRGDNACESTRDVEDCEGAFCDAPPDSCVDTPKDCANMGEPTCRNFTTYLGSKATTFTGRTCQRWDATAPHSHRYTNVGAHNHCRNPDGDTAPWCFTTDPNVKWEYCFKDCNEEKCRNRASEAQCKVMVGMNYCAPNSRYNYWMRSNCCRMCQTHVPPPQEKPRPRPQPQGGNCQGDTVAANICQQWAQNGICSMDLVMKFGCCQTCARMGSRNLPTINTSSRYQQPNSSN